MTEQENQGKISDENIIDLSTAKKSRQQIRAEEREKIKKQENVRKQLNSGATKKDLVQLQILMQRMSERMYHLDILSAAMERVFVSKGMMTREELNGAIQFESDRSTAYKEIMEDDTNKYEDKLEKCRKWDIEPDTTYIPLQMVRDKELSVEDRNALAEKYNITRLLNEEELKKLTDQLKG